MGIDDKLKETVGKAKEAVGDAINNPKLERQGEIDQADAKLDRAGDAVKKTADDAADKVGDLADKAKDKLDDITK